MLEDIIIIFAAGADVGLNIIAGKPTNQCSTLAKATSGLAVDGNFSTTNCAQTGVMYNPWWAVDMGQNSYVYEVNITTALNQSKQAKSINQPINQSIYQ